MNVIIIAVLTLSYININFVKRDLATVKRETESASMNLMINAANALQSDAIKHMVRIQDLLDTLGTVDGTLVRYEVKQGGGVEWEALVPPSFQGGVGSIRGQVQPGMEKDGRVRIKGTN